MTERGLPLADGAQACPFVAFEDDRDERSSVPDRRHRCYAEARPAPRALAHQEAYCLSSAFPVCPTFQDWARREAARSRGGAPTAPSASAGMNRAATGVAADAASASAAGTAADAAGMAANAASGADGAAAPGARAGSGSAGAWAGTLAPGGADGGGSDPGIDRLWDASDPDEPSHPAADDRPLDPDDDDRHPVDDDADTPAEDHARRNPPRDWAAPPPWLASSERRRDDDAEAPPFLGRRTAEPGQGLAGSSADWLAGGPPPPPREAVDDGDWSTDSRSAAAVGAGLDSERRAAAPPVAAPGRRRPAHDEEDIEHDEGGRRPARRPRAYAQHLGGPDGPDWEQPRRYEAYPTIKTRVGLPAVPRILGLAGLVIILALALFFLPGILNIGGGTPAPGGSARPSAPTGAGPSASVGPAESAAPTPLIYTIKQNDSLLKIAKAHGVSIEALMAANPTIKNPNKISVGQQIAIPVPSDAAPNEIGGSTAP